MLQISDMVSLHHVVLVAIQVVVLFQHQPRSTSLRLQCICSKPCRMDRCLEDVEYLTSHRGVDHLSTELVAISDNVIVSTPS